MVIRKVIVAALLLTTCSIEASVLAPAVAPIAYARAVPYNVLPFANSVNIFRKTLAAPLVAAYPGIAPAVVRTGLAYPGPGLAYPGPGLAYPGPGLTYPGPGLAYPDPAIAAAPAFAPAPVPAFGSVPAFPPVAAPAPVAVPGVRVSSFLPAPFAPMAAVVGPAPAVAAPVVRSFGPPQFAPASFAPAPFAPSPFAPAAYAHPINPAFGRSVHAVAPAAYPSPAIPAVAPAPILGK